MKNRSIRTPLLRVFAIFYGHLGLQLLPYSLKSPQTMLNAIYNLTLLSILEYALIFHDPLKVEQVLVNRMKYVRPGMYNFFRLCSGYMMPGFTLVTSIYFLAYGARIIRLLDSAPFRRTMSTVRWRTSTLPFFIVVGMQLYGFFENQQLSYEFLNIFCVILVMLRGNFDYFLIHYTQSATLRALRGIERSLMKPKIETIVNTVTTITINNTNNTNNTTVEASMRKAVDEIRRLAKICDHLGTLLSFPILLFFTLQSISALSIVYLAALTVSIESIRSAMAGYLSYMTAICAYVIYLAQLNRRSLHCLQRIETRLGVIASENQRRLRRRGIPVFRLSDNYADQFRMRIFRLAPSLDTSALLTLVVNVIGVAVFFYQTH